MFNCNQCKCKCSRHPESAPLVTGSEYVMVAALVAIIGIVGYVAYSAISAMAA